MLRNDYCVYMHVLPSGKKYIGITSWPPQFRWSSGHGYNYNKKFHDDIVKYGWNNIEHIILFDNLYSYEAYRIESKLISEYRTYNPDYGYNIERGAGHGRPESVKNKIREAHALRKLKTIKTEE